jgi:hypothetical protein
MLSKACVVGAYQRKLEEIARFPDVRLTVIVPPLWREAGSVIPLERAYAQGYDLVVEPMAFNGRHHLHFYPALARRLARLRPDIFHVDEEPYNFVTFHAFLVGQRAGARCLFFTWQNLLRHYFLLVRTVRLPPRHLRPGRQRGSRGRHPGKGLSRALRRHPPIWRRSRDLPAHAGHPSKPR